jgi:glycerol-3-phosphate acyltransferase PlsX
MGAVFAREVIGIPEPRVGILSNGVEETKGTDATRQAYELLKSSTLEFVGYVEGNEIMSGKADVVVSDGFSGNLVLKSIEGVGEFIVDSLYDIFTGGALNRLGLALLRDRIREFRKRIDYAEYGGAPLLGINATCIIGHGRSTPKAVANAIRLAAEFEARGYRQRLAEEIAKNGAAKQ